MKQYEFTVLLNPDLETNPDPTLDKIKQIIAENGGKIINETVDGKKHLAYAVKKQNFALYYYYELELPALAPAKISNVLNITDGVLRYLLVSVDPRKEKLQAKNQARKLKNEETNKEK